uniref:DNA topoisomerase (ATP-hydrolyzing) n=1 Tax=Angiostrongylus cantonensis TaxID=6313 RepID=A0A0K0DJ11_ANGCA
MVTIGTINALTLARAIKKDKISVIEWNILFNSKAVDCALLIGDSAKALAIAGLEVVGRDRYGVFPIVGKPANVSGLSMERVTSCSEINSLLRILGLTYGVDYSLSENRVKLRYGGIIILTDQDEDGSHIKGLIINLLHTFWPQLLRCGFVWSFVTPLLKLLSSLSHTFNDIDDHATSFFPTANHLSVS